MIFKHRLTPCLVTLALASMSGQLLSAPMHSASATYTVGSAASVTETVSDTLPSTVDVLNSNFDSGSNIFYHTYGTVVPGYANFGSRSSGTGIYDLRSPYGLTDYLFTVPGTGTVSVYFNFVIDNGELGVYCGVCTGGGLAQINIDISADGISKASGEGKLEVDGAGVAKLTHSGLVSDHLITSTASGTTSNVPGSGGSVVYSWGATPVSVYLGDYAGGSTVDIDYDLVTIARGNFGSFDADFYAGGGCDNIGNVERVNLLAFGEPACFSGNTIARSGDPFGVGVNALVTTNSVPEPASLALVGAGLAAASFAGRRRKSKKRS